MFVLVLFFNSLQNSQNVGFFFYQCEGVIVGHLSAIKGTIFLANSEYFLSTNTDNDNYVLQKGAGNMLVICS